MTENDRDPNEAVALLMEPRPADISAAALRATYRDWQWVSWHMHESPDGWWQAQIGTDHGPPEDDDKPVRWEPARDPFEEIADAWLIVEEMGRRGFHAVVKTPFVPGEPYHAGFTPHGMSGWNGRPDHAGSGDTPAHAICKAFLAAVQS